MMKLKQQRSDEFVLEVSGTLTREDYEQVIPEVEKIVSEQGKVRALVELNEFKGWTPVSLVDELRFDVRHRNDIEKVALVGEGRVQEAMAQIASPIFSGEVRFFPKEKMSEAKVWLAAS